MPCISETFLRKIPLAVSPGVCSRHALTGRMRQHPRFGKRLGAALECSHGMGEWPAEFDDRRPLGFKPSALFAELVFRSLVAYLSPNSTQRFRGEETALVSNSFLTCYFATSTQRVSRITVIRI